MSIHEDSERGSMSSSEPRSDRSSADLEAVLGSMTESMRNRIRKHIEDTMPPIPEINPTVLSHYSNHEVEKRTYLLMALHCTVNLALAIPGELPSPLMDGLNLRKIWNQERHYRYEVMLHSMCDLFSFAALVLTAYVASALFWRAGGPQMRPLTNDKLVQILRNSFMFTCISILLRMVRLCLTVPFIFFGLLVVVVATVIHVRPMRHHRQD